MRDISAFRKPVIPENLTTGDVRQAKWLDELPCFKDGVQQWHAFFSSQQAERFGFNIYLDASGNQVPITAVMRDPTSIRTYGWDDMEYRGTVVKWHRTYKTRHGE